MTSVHDFINMQNSMMDSLFPNTIRRIVAGGDDISELIIELKEGNKTLRYNPYLLFMQSEEYEETIQGFIEQWREELRKSE